MREIKFRAWDSRLQKMVETGFHIIGEVTVFDLLQQHFNPMDGLTTIERLNDCIIMQFTGLFDKNGKEYYQDDLYRHNNSNLVFIIKWNDDIPGFWLCWDDGGFSQPFNKTTAENGEVFGNIYENSDLLTEVKKK